MASDNRIGRRELITKALAGGLAVGTFTLSGKTILWAVDKPPRKILTEDISTLGEPAAPRTCAPYKTKRFEFAKYRAYKHVTAVCRMRYSAECLETFELK